jgi:phosphopantetheinyl transferase (holo-ACP synthase)
VSLVALGLDLVDLERAARLLARHGDRALSRLLTPAERADLEARADPIPGFAARLAAKEAGWKASGFPRPGGWGGRTLRWSGVPRAARPSGPTAVPVPCCRRGTSSCTSR